jgi:drug/metabolite transporter (DMT)-like permease
MFPEVLLDPVDVAGTSIIVSGNDKAANNIDPVALNAAVGGKIEIKLLHRLAAIMLLLPESFPDSRWIERTDLVTGIHRVASRGSVPTFISLSLTFIYDSGMVSNAIRPYVWMLSGCFWFSVMGLSAHALGPLCDWQVVAVARSALATVFAFLAACVVGARLAFLGPRVLWIRSIAGSCSMVATFYALTRLPVSDVLTLQNTSPIWVALLSWPLAGERPTWAVWGAVACSVTGVVLTQQPDLLFGGGVTAAADQPLYLGLSLPAWSALAASVFTACAMLGLNRIGGVSSLGVVVHFSGVATIFCGMAYFLFDHTTGIDRLRDPEVLGLLLVVGATATVGQIFLTLAFRSGSPTKVSVVGLSQVVMVMLFEAAIGWKTVTATTIVGTALVLGPTAWLMARETQKTRQTLLRAYPDEHRAIGKA